MQSQGLSPQQRRQNPIKLQRDASERLGRNPKAPKETASNPSRQFLPDRSKRQKVRTRNPTWVQVLPIGVRQESRGSKHLSHVPVRLPMRRWSTWSFIGTPLFGPRLLALQKKAYCYP